MRDDDDVRCAVQVRHRTQPVSPAELVQLGHSRDALLLEFLNEFGESYSVVFRPNRKLIDFKNSELKKNFRDCHLEGVADGEHSAISVCSVSQLGGILAINGRHYVLVAENNGKFVLLPQGFRECRWGARQKREATTTNAADYYARHLDGKWRFVELALVADYSVYEKYEKNATAVHERLISLANYINTLYTPLNIRVILVWADVWVDGNQIEVLPNSDETLSNFLNFRKGLIKPHPHDNAHLLTNIRFENNVVGKAYKGTMCSFDFSGGVDMDHNTHAMLVAATVAHEMGHNFGMEHDTNYEDCRCPAQSCIMAPATGAIVPTYWSECSLRYLQQSLSRGADYCLRNSPDSAFGGARCGNGIVESGEECDCGSESACGNKCCDPRTCKLAKEAECAEGDCCDLQTCKVKPASTRCRDASNVCDLPEYCDGQMEHCPADFFVRDGSPCPGVNAPDFCYNGVCGNRDMQCRYIWGPTGSNAAPVCYAQNDQGNYIGNCGHDLQTDGFSKCDPKDVLCGRLQCNHETEKLAFGDPSTVRSAYSTARLPTGENIACRVIWTKYVGTKKDPDPGMVPDGAFCGADRMCVGTKCENRTETVKLAPKCIPESCNDAGVCNNMGNCHCNPGYGGTGCAIPGYGGSVNSGPSAEGSVIHVGHVVFWMLIAFVIIFIGASIFIKRKKNVWLHKQIWHRVKKVLKLQRLLVPIRKAPPPPGPPISTSDLNNLWGESSTAALHASRPSPPSFSPPVIPSGSFAPATITPSVTRSASVRPKEAPPQIPRRPDPKSLRDLYDERGGDLEVGGLMVDVVNAYEKRALASAVAADAQAKRLNRSESTNRPGKPPPPPPHNNSAPAYQLTHTTPETPPITPPITPPDSDANRVFKLGKEKKVGAILSVKPAVAAKPKPKVKDIAARFDPKSSELTTNLA